MTPSTHTTAWPDGQPIDVSHIPYRRAGSQRGKSVALAAMKAIGKPASTNQIAYAIGVMLGAVFFYELGAA